MKELITIHPEKAFLFLAITFGILLVFITPPFQTPDEPAHFYRAFQISEFKIIPNRQQGVPVDGATPAVKQENKVGGELPVSLKITVEKTMGGVAFHPETKISMPEIIAASKIRLDLHKREFLEFPNTARYSPVVYLPQTLGILSGKLFNSSPLFLMYLGRLFNTAVWIFFVYFAIKTVPVSKWVFFLLALTPMSLFISASMSADVLTNAAAFLLISLILKYVPNDNDRLNNSKIFSIFLLSVVLSLTKQIYFLIPFMFLIIPVKKIGSKTKYFAIFFSLIFVSLFAVSIWFLTIKDIIVPLKSDISAIEQAIYVFNNPMKFLEISIKTLSSKKFISHFIGQLGWLDAQMSWFFLLPYLFMLIFTALTDNDGNFILTSRHKMIMAATLFTSIILICLSQYLTWTPVGRTRIQGIQGRYFIPLSPLIFLLLSTKKIKLNFNLKNFAIVCFSFFSLIYTLIVLIKRFYI